MMPPDHAERGQQQSSQSTQYNSLQRSGDTTSVTDPKDNATSNVYDADRRLITRRPRGHPQRRARALFGYLNDALYRDLLAAN
jgi:hypothetical protein